MMLFFIAGGDKKMVRGVDASHSIVNGKVEAALPCIT